MIRLTESTGISRNQQLTELNNRILAFTKSLNPDLVLQTHEGELYRSESGTGFTSAEDWNYHATENVKKDPRFVQG